ncbi:hypothetical protein [Paraburkholderia caballeronis]|uniref:Uncharacterized protein n=1 Tax=Paraburkholderia caballeronis TaxID=416943 RepID=A0A1H7TY11_9BURK|nr:hypothetical protein [Paraburkholderia caballeronis]PXW23396.1 hypothetical protein C7403_110134 [Paraburkholderia caballeronis]PXW98389.1 hypothetical protein C7407_110134 [Paraburkholderia caballeronis]RAJ95120.1 hypothetical protein C7409_110135 [Paraburkholderia caballeronis]SEC55996.1 hypothetical protein SAMN05445871_2426 [Paraburkholderia caballeronis]SEL89752.1 hypothetical protein SAMN05192542_11724 [Paraburkholderia caballeronis]
MAAIEISVRTNVREFERGLNDWVRKQIPFATVQSLNAMAWESRGAVQDAMRSDFDNPVPRTINSVRVGKATKQSLRATVWIDDEPNKGIPPEKWLSAEILGGPRHHKRFERALQARGLMPSGTYAVPGAGAPLDASGNIPGSFLVQLLSYLAAFGEQGYRANMTDKRRKRLHNIVVSEKGYKKIAGVAYFVSKGTGRNLHLPAGIYSKTGTHGSDIKPVIRFVRIPSYVERLPFGQIVEQRVKSRFDEILSEQFARAIASAKR